MKLSLYGLNDIFKLISMVCFCIDNIHANQQYPQSANFCLGSASPLHVFKPPLVRIQEASWSRLHTLLQFDELPRDAPCLHRSFNLQM